MRSSRPNIARVGYQNQERQKGGMPCPGCGAHVAVTLEGLLAGGRFSCSNGQCRGVLRLDASASAEALNALRRFKKSHP